MMRLEMSKLGDVVRSRPAGKEAFVLTRAYIFPDLDSDEQIELDFAQVKVFAPSWTDEIYSWHQILLSQ